MITEAQPFLFTQSWASRCERLCESLWIMWITEAGAGQRSLVTVTTACRVVPARTSTTSPGTVRE